MRAPRCLAPCVHAPARVLWVSVAALGLLGSTCLPSQAQAGGRIVLAIHGGASGAAEKTATKQREDEHRGALRRSLEAGFAVLKENGSSLDAVQAAIVILEDSPLFNAGKGAVFTDEGRNELDASIMDGKTMKAGAVGGVTIVRNPIIAARAVMEKTWHVLLVGPGADRFARETGLEIVSPDYFRTDHQWKRYEEKRAGGGGSRRAAAAGTAHAETGHFGTVGAVALDRHGNLAAGTSTGGLMLKKFGRLGDSPIIGAGTYADDATCAVSCTGEGEYFIRHAIAHDVSARMRYKGARLGEAARGAIHETLSRAGGGGGLIALDGEGNFAAEHNTPGLAYGVIDASGQITIGFAADSR